MCSGSTGRVQQVDYVTSPGKQDPSGLRRNLKPKPPRSKSWTLEQHGDWEQHDHQLRERIMPIDEKDRRRALKQAVFRTAATQPSTDKTCTDRS